MDERPASATAALDIMRDWDWRRCDPDGAPFHPGKDLSFVVSRLALEGLDRPDQAVLTLLCRGELVARGDYRWRKYQHGNCYQLEGECEDLKPLQWQILANLIAEELRELAGEGWPNPLVDLDRLNIKECPVYEWEFGSNRFSTAICPPETPTYDATYLEEWFTAWDINVWPADLGTDRWDADSAPKSVVQDGNKGGRPPVADWELAALEMAGRYYRGDFKPQTIADVGRELASWLGKQDLHPSDSVVRIHAKRIFDAFHAWERE